MNNYKNNLYYKKYLNDKIIIKWSYKLKNNIKVNFYHNNIENNNLNYNNILIMKSIKKIN